MKKIFTAFLLFFSLMIQAQTNYYIDPDGNNSNTGSIDSPWLTLAYACSHAKTSGNIIHANAGTYLETVQSSLAVGVSIEGEGVTSIIKSRISAANTPTIILTSETQGTNGNQSISKIKMDGDALTAYSAIKVTARSNVLIHDCTFKDFNNNGVIFNGALGDGLPTTWATGNKFYNNIVTNCSKYVVGSEGRWALGINGQDGMLIYDNTMTQTSRPAGNNGYLIKGVEGYNKGLKIYNNVLTKKPYAGIGDYWDFAIEMWNNLGGVEIYDNTIQGSIDMAGTTKGTYTYGAYIHDNIIGPTSLDIYESNRGIYLEYYNISDVIIEKNYIKNVCQGIFIGFPASGNTFENVRISYNIFDNIGEADGGSDYKGWGIRWSPEDNHNHIVNNFNVWNNTIIAHSGTKSTMYGIEVPGTVTNISIRNNIVQGFNYGPTYVNGGIGVSIDYLSIENNIFYNNGNNNLPGYSGITPTHNTTQNNYTVNPKFVSSSDFHLQSGSSAINTGLELGLTLDYDDIPIAGLPDIGAYEFISNHPPSILDQGFQLNECSPNGTSVGTVIATDPDAGQTLSYSIESGNTNDVFAINASTGELSIASSAALNVDFTLVVKVQDNGVGELSSQASITINVIPTGIEITENNSTIKVYPNPVSDELIIEIQWNKDRQGFNILNSIGHIVFKGNLSERTIVPTTNFSPGVYLVKLYNGKSFEFKKIMKL
jgi:hypothetical protein